MIRKTLGALFLIICCPLTAVLFWYTAVHLDGSLLSLLKWLTTNGALSTFKIIFLPVIFGSKISWSILGIFITFELILMKALPGPIFLGPISKTGFVPQYKDNGLFAFFVTLI